MYAIKSNTEGNLEKPVLGSAPSTGSWVGARAFDPTSPPIQELDVTPAANGKKQKEKEKKRQKHAGTGKRTRDPSPGKKLQPGQPGQA